MTSGSGLPMVAVVGRPNVGKSSLVNRVLGRRQAIVEETPGVTRDRSGFEAEWSGTRFEIVDTGGLEPGPHGLEAAVVEQAHVAIEAADVIVLVVDAVAGPTEDDMLVAATLRRSGKPVVVAVNKVDDPQDEPAAADFHRLGLGDPVALSALHGRGSGDFLQALVNRLPAAGGQGPELWASMAIVGRPNVGKSSVLNALLGETRAIVDAAAGTTRDPVDSYLRIAVPGGEANLRVVDTAGLRRPVRIKDPIEYFSFLRARGTLARVDLALVVVDSAEGVAALDQRIAEEIVAHGRACVIALNKWDLATPERTDRARLERDIVHRLRFLHWAPVVRTSAVTGRGVDKLLPAIRQAVASHRTRMTTSVVNEVLAAAQARRPHARTRGRAIRVLYGVQARVGPPTVLLFANGHLQPDYLRYLEHRIRAVEPFSGTPVKMEVRVKTRLEVDQ
ncbi:MAG: ribosome biogenesis GTPase Der [Actinomycetota bacterium]|nr:ribosome biogenesis GTPase Der [Actinomycetota bacterium]